MSASVLPATAVAVEVVEPGEVELSIVMPCLNERETVATCIRQALRFLAITGVVGEVIIADNGSTDGSQQIAADEGARVVNIAQKGYGAALIGGISAARGAFVAMGDADDSYDFEGLGPFIDELRGGADLVMGNRFRGGIEPGAMPNLHRYLGNPVLSMIGRLLFDAPVKDFHCGLRAFRRDAITDLGLRTTGMEFASEMVVKASLSGLRIVEVPTTLRKDGRSRPPHLRSWHDGWRHLRFLLLYSPRWVFFYPGLVLMGLGLIATAVLLVGPIRFGDFGLDIGTMLYSAALAVVGYQAVLFFVLSKVFALHEGFLPSSQRFRLLQDRLNLENVTVAGVVIFVLGLIWLVVSFVWWGGSDFGPLDPASSVRRVMPAVLSLIIGAQTIMAGLFLSLLRIGVVKTEPEVATTEAWLPMTADVSPAAKDIAAQY